MVTTTHDLRVLNTLPWDELNEYEGQLEIDLPCASLQPITVYVQVSNSKQWQQIASLRKGALSLERTGSVRLVPSDVTVGLQQIDGVIYKTTGVACRATTEEVELVLGDGFILSVELDRSVHLGESIPTITPGDRVQIVGKLQLDPHWASVQ